MAAEAPTAGFLSPFLAHGRPLLALWASPALVLALLTSLAPAPAPLAAVDVQPTPEQTFGALAGLVAQLYPQLFLLVAFAAPTARLMAGGGLASAVGSLRSPAVLGVAALTALFLTFALLLTMVPGLLALYLNPLMGLIFLATGTIAGASAAVALFGRWLHAPALAAERGLGPTESLDASRALAKAERDFGGVLGLALLFVFVLGFAAASGALAARALPEAAWAARTAATWLVLWPGVALVEAKVAARHLAALRGAAAPATPTLALRQRPSRCPRCGTVASVRSGAATQVRCAGCGLAATVT